jgi:hypothetical protein
MTGRELKMFRIGKMQLVLIVIGCLPILTACNKTTGGAEIAVGAACRSWPETTYSKKDTPQTQVGNKFNNTSRDGFCAGQGPGPTPPIIGRAK